MAVVAHSSSIGAAFGALDLDLDRHAEPSGPPPPSFTQVTAPNTQHRIPVYIVPLRQRIAEQLQRHTELTHRLDALGNLPARIERNKDALYQCSGRLSSQEARVKTFQADDKLAHNTYNLMVGNFAKRLINKRPTRVKAVQLAKEAVQRARTDLDQHLELIAQTEAQLARLRAELADLELHSVEYRQLIADLDHINAGLFGGPTPEFPEEDLLEWEHNVLLETAKQLHAEASREKRARHFLTQASPSLQACLVDLQKALQLCIDLGVPQNRKYSKQIFVGGSTSTTVKATTLLVLRTTTNSGKFYTTIANARGSQALVRRAPDFAIIELHLMPGQRSPRAVDEKGLHKAMEASYAQARFCETYLRNEINRSLERQKKLREQSALLEARIAQAKADLDAYRQRIVIAVTNGDEASLLDDVAQRSGSDASSQQHQQEEGARRRPRARVSFSVDTLCPLHVEGPMIVGKVINEVNLRGTVLSHTRQRSFSFTTTGTMTQLVSLPVIAGNASTDSDAHGGSHDADVDVDEDEKYENDDDSDATEASSRPRQVTKVVAVQMTRDSNVAATVAMSAVTDVESPAERLRKEALRRLRTILASSVGTPEREDVLSWHASN